MAHISNKPDLIYYMPLSNGASPKDGPSKSIFSVPSFNYSADTQKLVKSFMNESRLTNTQKNGFQSILRKGDALPTRPSDIYRQELFKHRHAEKARAIGIPIMKPDYHRQMTKAHLFMRYNTGGRRSYDTIKSSGELESPAVQIRRYIPCDKEKEKVRFAHRMAYGKDPPQNEHSSDEFLGPKVNGLKAPSREMTPISNASVMNERFFELVKEIQDRVEFLESMSALGNSNGKAYHVSIVSQIQELVAQMKLISDDKTQEYIKALKLDKIDKCFDEKGYQVDNLFCGKESSEN